MPRQEHEFAVFALQLETWNTLDAKLLRSQTLLGENGREQLALPGMLDIDQPRTGQPESSSHGGVGRQCATGVNKPTLWGRDGDPIAGRRDLFDVASDGPIPDMRLPCVEVDEAHPRSDPAERSGEVVGTPHEVFEYGVVRPKHAGNLAASPPVPPPSREGSLEFSVLRVVVRRSGGQKALQGPLRLSERQVACDPALPSAEIPEALLSEVVHESVFAHLLDSSLNAGFR
jgi:hypothetical protein